MLIDWAMHITFRNSQASSLLSHVLPPTQQRVLQTEQGYKQQVAVPQHARKTRERMVHRYLHPYYTHNQHAYTQHTHTLLY